MSKPINIYEQYEVVKVPFPFVDLKTEKVRPALVLSSAIHFNAKIGLSVMAMITSLKPSKDFWPGDVVIESLAVTGLPVASIVRFKLFTLDHRLILGRLGHLAEKDRLSVQQKLKEILL